jgi:hypothetical protein
MAAAVIGLAAIVRLGAAVIDRAAAVVIGRPRPICRRFCVAAIAIPVPTIPAKGAGATAATIMPATALKSVASLVAAATGPGLPGRIRRGPLKAERGHRHCSDGRHGNGGADR